MVCGYLLGLSLAACSSGAGPTKQECEDLAEHVAELLVADRVDEKARPSYIWDITEDISPDYVASCLERGKRPEVTCMMEAENLDALSACTPAQYRVR